MKHTLSIVNDRSLVKDLFYSAPYSFIIYEYYEYL